MKRFIALVCGTGFAALCYAQGAPVVKPSPATPVEVINSTANPVPVTVVNQQGSGPQPFQVALCRDIGTPARCPAGSSQSFAVPSDRRAVIEYVSGECPQAGSAINPLENITGALLTTTVNGVIATHLFPTLKGLTGNGDLNGVYVAQQTRVYADPGTTVTLGASVGGLLSGHLTCSVTVSGYTSAL